MLAEEGAGGRPGEARPWYCGKNRYIPQTGADCQPCPCGLIAQPGSSTECTSCDADGKKPWYMLDAEANRCICSHNQEYCTCIENDVPPPTRFEVDGVEYCHHGQYTATIEGHSHTVEQPDFLQGTAEECMKDCAARPTCVGFAHSQRYAQCWFRDEMSVEIQEKEDDYQITDYFNSRIEGDVACFAKPIQSPEEKKQQCASTIKETKPTPAPSPCPALSGATEAPAPAATLDASASVRIMLSQTLILAVQGGLNWCL